MPSGKTHDAITILLSPAVLCLSYAATHSSAFTFVATVAFLFGGSMFGPDLDTVSSQYSRWSIFRFIWYPYRTIFKHRSRWSHGLIFGTFFRVVYFMGVITLAAMLAAFLIGIGIEGSVQIVKVWRDVRVFLTANAGENFALAAFVGMWLGAASHTLADVAITYIKTGRVPDLL